jgi:hypothetical protein
VKAITVHAPYAHLLAWSKKRYETRGWATNYGGWLAIHTGKSTEVLEQVASEMVEYGRTKKSPSLFTLHFLQVLDEMPNIDRSTFRLSDLPLGSIIAVGKLTACIPGTQLLQTISEREKAFGYFDESREKRFGWQLDKVFMLPKPITCKGQQGIWDVPDSIVKNIQAQYITAKGA